MKTLTYSISNNIIPAIKFFKPDYTYENCILVLARQHPCETMGSFIAEALMKELTQSSLIQDWILDEFEVIVIPMVNPDGVIHGMSRVNMAGLDLNRHWGEHIIKVKYCLARNSHQKHLKSKIILFLSQKKEKLNICLIFTDTEKSKFSVK